MSYFVTDSGKPSLILAIFFMLHLSNGMIMIDDVPAPRLLLNLGRCYVNAIAEDPYIHSSIIRVILDPEATLKSDLLLSVLPEIHVWHLLQAHGGLDGTMDHISLSRGQ